MQWSVLNHIAAVSSPWLRSPGIQNQPAKHGTLPAHQAQRGPWAVPKGHKYKPLHTHAQQRTHLCRPPLLLRLRRCEATLLVAKYSAQRITSPKARALRGKNVESGNSRCSQYHTEKIGTSLAQARAGRRRRRDGYSACLLGCVRTGASHTGTCHADVCLSVCYQTGSWQGFSRKNPSVRCTKLPLFCWSGLWITNICTRAT